MSYDTYVHCHTCGENLLRQTSANAGCAGLWEAAGAVLKDWDGKTAHEVLPMLVGAIRALRDDLVEELMNSGGEPIVTTDEYVLREFTITYLEQLRDACCRDPFATVRVSH